MHEQCRTAAVTNDVYRRMIDTLPSQWVKGQGGREAFLHSTVRDREWPSLSAVLGTCARLEDCGSVSTPPVTTRRRISRSRRRRRADRSRITRFQSRRTPRTTPVYQCSAKLESRLACISVWVPGKENNNLFIMQICSVPGGEMASMSM